MPGSNEGWILARALRYSAESGEWEVKDEDEADRKARHIVHERYVRRLEPTAQGLTRGDPVLAVYPDTTVFYLGEVYKQIPKATNSDMPEIFIKFEDDNTEGGTTPARKLPALYVIPLP
ncbi:unnamed protein product, partial [Phaeothamnion confervicola]